MNDTEQYKSTYDAYYQTPNVWHYREWLYRPFIEAVLKRARVSKGGRALDVGCGQGFFTALLHGAGMDAAGVDISERGIAAARRSYPDVTFCQTDIFTEPATKFPLVFARSLAMYDTPDLASCAAYTQALLDHVSPGGVLIFDYHTNLAPRKRNKRWTLHSPADLQRHFQDFAPVRVYFVLRYDILLVGRLAFTRPFQWLARVVSRYLGIGGEILVIARKGRIWSR